MLQPAFESAGITSYRKLCAGSASGSFTATLTVADCPAAVTVITASPEATGSTQPSDVTFAAAGLLLA